MRKVSRWLHSLQAQLILWAILPVILVIIGLALTGVYSHQRAMRDFVIERDRVLVRLLNERIESALSQGRLSPDGGDVDTWLTLSEQDLTGSVLVVDQRGHILAHSDPDPPPEVQSLEAMIIDRARQETEGAGVITQPSGEPLVLTFTTVRGTGWRVIIYEPAQELLGPILRFSSLGPIAAGIAAGLAILILTFGWRTIVQPLQQLSKAAGEVSFGNHSVIEAEVVGVAEIEELHGALSDMVHRLESYQTGVLDYLDAVTQGQEAERAHLARELHDGPVQSLIALSQRIEMTQQRVERGELDAAQQYLKTLRQAEVGVIEELRRIIGALRPAYLEDLGFVPALEMLVRNADARSDAEIRLQTGPNLRRLCPEVELAAYRIAQEGLNNALQHAEAEHITISVHCDVHGLALRITDDGVGFEPAARLDAYTRQGHFGLVGLQERVRQLGGSLHIDTEPGAGATVRVRLPDRRGFEQCPT
jgi:signal transduction histidine kinase